MGGPKPTRRTVKTLPMKALYTAASLAAASGISRRRMLVFLESREVQRFLVGNSVMVPLTEIQTKRELVWDSIRAAERARQLEEKEGKQPPPFERDRGLSTRHRQVSTPDRQLSTAYR